VNNSDHQARGQVKAAGTEWPQLVSRSPTASGGRSSLTPPKTSARAATQRQTTTSNSMIFPGITEQHWARSPLVGVPKPSINARSRPLSTLAHTDNRAQLPAGGGGLARTAGGGGVAGTVGGGGGVAGMAGGGGVAGTAGGGGGVAGTAGGGGVVGTAGGGSGVAGTAGGGGGVAGTAGGGGVPGTAGGGGLDGTLGGGGGLAGTTGGSGGGAWTAAMERAATSSSARRNSWACLGGAIFAALLLCILSSLMFLCASWDVILGLVFVALPLELVTEVHVHVPYCSAWAIEFSIVAVVTTETSTDTRGRRSSAHPLICPRTTCHRYQDTPFVKIRARPEFLGAREQHR
jgi:hypothetical protein